MARTYGDGTRPMTDAERRIVAAMLDRPMEGVEALRVQAGHCQVRVVGGVGPSLGFVMNEEPRPARSEMPYASPVLAQYNDVDGMPVIAELHVQQGFLYSLDVYRIDGDPPVRSIEEVTEFEIQYPDLDDPRPLRWPDK